MRRLALVLLAVGIAGIGTPAAAQVGATIACRDNGWTYNPRGDHWAATPGTPVTNGPEPVVYRLSTGSVGGLNITEVHNAMNRAMDTWLGVRCSVDCTKVTCDVSGKAPPNVTTVPGPTYAYRDGGDSPPTSYQNVFYFVDTNWRTHPGTDDAGNQIYWPAGTLAMTTNVYTTSTFYLVHSDMAINDDNFNWRIGNTSGCDFTTDNTCYDVESVVLHEIGHFFGLNHVQCTDAVMYPTGTAAQARRDLTDHEVNGLCAVYVPRPNNINCGLGSPNALCRAFGEQCNSDAECAEIQIDTTTHPGMCLFDPGYPQWKKCTIACNTTADCPLAHVCAAIGANRFCTPGPNFAAATAVTGGGCDCDVSAQCNNDTNNSCPCDPDCSGSSVGGGDPPSTATGTRDTCAPCTSGDQCLSGICVGDATGNSICVQGCLPGADCGTGFDCLSTSGGWAVCFPQDPVSCAATAEVTGAQLDELCYIEDNHTAANSWFNPCGPDLVCFGFTPKCGGFGSDVHQEGACVNVCDATSRPCPDGLTCCFGTDENGNCITSPSPDVDYGGCFNLRREGESCVNAENSVCHNGLGCFAFQNPSTGLNDLTLARCYSYCGANTCIEGSTCNSFPDACESNKTFPLCCDNQTSSSDYCAPGASPTFFEIGVECNVNADCDSGLCLKFDNTSACSRTCRLGAGNGCPDNTDVNADGSVDGGFTCRLIDGKGHCWPDAGPITQPAVDCTREPNHPDCGSGIYPPGGCCNAVPMRPGDMFVDLLPWMPLIFWRSRRRRRRRA